MFMVSFYFLVISRCDDFLQMMTCLLYIFGWPIGIYDQFYFSEILNQFWLLQMLSDLSCRPFFIGFVGQIFHAPFPQAKKFIRSFQRRVGNESSFGAVPLRKESFVLSLF